MTKTFDGSMAIQLAPWLHSAAILTLLVMSSISAPGCGSRGQPSGRPDIDAVPEIERRGAATKADIYEFRAKVRKRGVAAAKQELPDLLASLEGYERLKLGEHK